MKHLALILALSLATTPAQAQIAVPIADIPCLVGLDMNDRDDPASEFLSGWFYGATQTAARSMSIRDGFRVHPLDVIGTLVDRCRANPGMTFGEMMAIAGRM